jgi:hypothetical protein
MKTTAMAMADPSTLNKTNGIAPHTPFVALRKLLPPFLGVRIIPAVSSS